MSKAEERALEAYPQNEVIVYGPFPGANEPNRIDDNLKYRIGYIEGYEQAEKDTIERAVVWLKDNANKYIVDLTETYPDAPVNIIVGGMCWEDLTKYLKEK